jgi:hypothetical protein
MRFGTALSIHKPLGRIASAPLAVADDQDVRVPHVRLKRPVDTTGVFGRIWEPLR